MMGQRMTWVFSMDQMWATCEKESWSWTALNPAQALGAGRARELIEKGGRKSGAAAGPVSQEPEQSDFPSSVCDRSQWGHELHKEHSCTSWVSQLYTVASQREPVADCIGFSQARPPLCVLTSSPFPLLTPVPPSILRRREEADWMRWRKGRSKRGNWEKAECVGPHWECRSEQGEEGNFSFKFCNFDFQLWDSFSDKMTFLSENACENEFHLPRISFGSRGSINPIEWTKIEGVEENSGSIIESY